MYVEGWNAHRVVRPSRLANAVIEGLLLRILDGEFQPGGDLLPEAALAQKFAVSRTILREALKVMEEKRVLRIRHGRSATVRPKNEWNILDPMVLTVLLEYGGSSTLAAELDEVRAALQGLMADLAAQRITPEQRRDLDLCLSRMRAEMPVEPGIGDPLAYREAAHLFAGVLSEAAGNEVARYVVETIDVPLRDEDPEHLQGAIPRTQEFAERLYARVVGLPAPDKQMLDRADPLGGAGAAPVSLPSRPPVQHGAAAPDGGRLGLTRARKASRT